MLQGERVRQPKEPAAQKGFDAREFLLRAMVALIFVAIFSSVAFWALLKDEPNRLQTLVVYVALALVAGIAFSAATVSQGKIEWGKLGISLGGGAAIGIATIYIVHMLLPLPAPLVLIQPSQTGSVLFSGSDPSLRVRRLQETQEFLVEILRPDSQEHFVTFLVVDGAGRSEHTYAVTQSGRYRRVEESQ